MNGARAPSIYSRWFTAPLVCKLRTTGELTKGGAEYSTDRSLNPQTGAIIGAIRSAQPRIISRRNDGKAQHCGSGSVTTSMVAARICPSVSSQRGEAWDRDSIGPSGLEWRPFERRYGGLTTGAANVP